MAKRGGDRKSDQAPRAAVDLIPRDEDRQDFRLLARARNGACKLKPDEWRNSRRALVALVRQRIRDTASVRRKVKGRTEPPQPKFSPTIKPTDNWNFSPVRYGRVDGEAGHGYIPGDVYANCLWYWTKARDVVAVPMFDLTPRGPYAKMIKANDATVSLPIKRANYIVLDVPYFGMAEQQYSNKKKDLSNMDVAAWTKAMKAIARSCSKAQRSGDLCTVISPNYRSIKDGSIFLATVAVRESFIAKGYQLHDLAYASRRVQQAQHVGMAILNNAAKSSKLMLTDIAEIITFRRR